MPRVRANPVTSKPSPPAAWRDAISHPLFATAREDKVEPVLREVRGRAIRAGHLISSPDGSPGYLHLVLSGRLQAYRLNAQGHRLLLEIIESGGLEGVLSVSGQVGHFTEAMTDSVIVSLSSRQLARLVEAEPRVGLALTSLVAAQLQIREEQMESMAAPGAAGIARILLRLARTLGHKDGPRVVLEVRLTHQMLADMLGVRRETVSVQWTKLVRSGAIEVIAGDLVLDRPALQRLARAQPTSPRGG